MAVTVEVFGAVRELIGAASARVDMQGPMTVRAALAALARRHPALVGPVLTADGCAPTDHFLLNLDGRRFLHDLDEVLPDGSHVLLLSAMAGGA